MTKKKFFFRILVINIITILLAFFVSIIIISHGYNDYILEKKESLFYKTQDKIVTIVENGYKKSDLTLLYQNGYHIYVFNNGKLILSNDNISTYRGSDFKEEINEDEFSKQFYRINSENLYSEKKVYIEDKEYNMYISKPLEIPKQEYLLKQLVQLVLIILFVGTVISVITSLIYDYYMKNQLNKVSSLLLEMENFNLDITTPIISKGELGNLELQVIKMYRNLQNTTENLEKEIIKVKKLEKDRYDFIRGVTHELKTPIMSMKIVLSEMLNDESLDIVRKKSLLKIDDKLSDMNLLIMEVISIYKYENSGDKGYSNFEDSITEILNIYAVIIEDKELEVEILKNTRYGNINIPFDNFMKVLSNLISNASKYAPIQSIITIRINEKEFSVENFSYNNMPNDSQELVKAFKSFNSNDEVSSHGLGLFVVDTILSKYNYKYLIERKNNIFKFKILLHPSLNE
ncbi:sensor histidine kinase [Carnobacterium maltaromaticum]|uniref:sensor histidine kinase n=1 Tax=Carnobacterium maltaromaticum TaxID=2751 RepID=UPI0039BEA6B2